MSSSEVEAEQAYLDVLYGRLDVVRNRTDVILEIANAVWVDESEKVAASFRRTVEESYRASIRSQVLKSGAAMEGINRWDGTSWTHLASNLDRSPTGLAVLDDGQGQGAALFATGPFAAAGPHASARIARYARTGAPITTPTA